MTQRSDPTVAPATSPAAPASAPAAGAGVPGAVPDLPAGIRGTDPAAPLQFTPADVAAASALLERAGAGGPEPAVTLSDEQIAALDGYARRQFVAAPWLEEHPEQRAFAAGVALRSLIAAEQIRLAPGPDGGGAQWQAAPEIAGALVLRRTARVFTTAERTVQTDHGPQVHRLHCYAHAAGVLEEEVTAVGLHRFTALSPTRAGDRLAAFVDPLGVGGAGGDPVLVRSSALAAHPIAQRLAATRALSVLTLVRTDQGGVQQLSVHATAAGVLTMEALDPGSEDPRLEVRSVDAAELRALASVLVGGAA